jgi:hypothetical protein
MKWRIDRVTVTQIVELEVTCGQPLHPAVRRAMKRSLKIEGDGTFS